MIHSQYHSMAAHVAKVVRVMLPLGKKYVLPYKSIPYPPHRVPLFTDCGELDDGQGPGHLECGYYKVDRTLTRSVSNPGTLDCVRELLFTRTGTFYVTELTCGDNRSNDSNIVLHEITVVQK